MSEFFKRISYSIGIAFVWLTITAVTAIKGDNAFIVDHITLANVLFYFWFVVSLIGAIFLLKKLWKKPL